MSAAGRNAVNLQRVKKRVFCCVPKLLALTSSSSTYHQLWADIFFFWSKGEKQLLCHIVGSY